MIASPILQERIDAGTADTGVLKDSKDFVTDMVRVNPTLTCALFSDKVKSSSHHIITWSLPTGLAFEHMSLHLGCTPEICLVKLWGHRLQSPTTLFTACICKSIVTAVVVDKLQLPTAKRHHDVAGFVCQFVTCHAQLECDRVTTWHPSFSCSSCRPFIKLWRRNVDGIHTVTGTQ